MGYTHYWTFNRSKGTAAQFRKAVTEINTILQALPEKTDTAGGGYSDEPLSIFGSDGTGKPEIKNNLICFNGDRSKDLDHEPFYLKRLGKDAWKFCKTTRKPYDLLACCSLIALANAYNDANIFSFSSDGDKEDWEPAIQLYNKTIGEITSPVVIDMLNNL